MCLPRFRTVRPQYQRVGLDHPRTHPDDRHGGGGADPPGDPVPARPGGHRGVRGLRSQFEHLPLLDAFNLNYEKFHNTDYG